MGEHGGERVARRTAGRGGGAAGRARGMTRLRPRPPRGACWLLSLLLATAAPVVAAAPAAAESHDPIRLPVIPSALTDGTGCTGASRTTVDDEPWQQRSLSLADAWWFASGEGVKVAVVDTGVSDRAPALTGRVKAVGDGGGDDCVGHGSFVAGLIAARVDDDVRFAGVAPAASILGVRGTGKRGAASAASVAHGIRAASDAGADVITVSAALPTGSRALTSAVSTALRRGAVVVAAAAPDDAEADPGGDASSAARDYWPAAQPGVLSVLDTGADGELRDGALRPRRADLTAPGDGVMGIGPKGSGHFTGSGPSLAAAFTAGTAALLLSADPNLSGSDVAERLLSTAYPADVPSLDPFAAVTAVRDTASPAPAATDRAAPVRLPPADPADARATRRAVLLAGAGAGVVLLVVWGAFVIPRGRDRRWRPHSRPVAVRPPAPRAD